MKSHVVTFWGTGRNEFGMPKPFHYYGIFVSPRDESHGYFNVSVLAMSSDSPSGVDGAKLIQATSEKDALDQTIRRLRDLPLHTGLETQDAPLPAIRF